MVKQGQAYLVMGNDGIEAIGGSCKASEMRMQMSKIKEVIADE